MRVYLKALLERVSSLGSDGIDEPHLTREEEALTSLVESLNKDYNDAMGI